MLDRNLFLIFLKPLNTLSSRYMVTGSVAAILYGEPRLTHDVDLVLELLASDTQAFLKLFPQDKFYCPPIEVIHIEVNRERRGHFNIIHLDSGFKADIYTSGSDPLHEWALDRSKDIPIEDEKIKVAPPEYVIIRKLQFFREGGSQKHLRDISAMLKASEHIIEYDELIRWIELLGLQTEWTMITKRREV